MTAKAVGGSRYAFMIPGYDLIRRLYSSRDVLEREMQRTAQPQRVAWGRKEETVKRKVAKRNQLDIFMEHCWVVARARRGA